AGCRAARAGGWRAARGGWRWASGPRRARPGRLAPGCQPIDGGPSFVAGGAVLELTGQFWGPLPASRRQAAAHSGGSHRGVRGARLSPRAGERGGLARRGGEGDRLPLLPDQGPSPPRGPRGEPRAGGGRGRARRRGGRAGRGGAARDRVSILRFFWRRPHLLTL